MSSVQDPTATQLPVELRTKFDRLRARLRQVETGLAFSRSGCFLLGALILAYLCDRLFDTGALPRAALLAAGLALAGWQAAIWLLRWVVSPRGLRQLAILVQRHHRRLGDRLLGVVELSDERTRPPHYSDELYRAAISQVAADAAKHEFEAAVDPAPLRRSVRLLGGAVAALAVAALVSPPALLNALVRWIAPWRDTPRFTLSALRDLPGRMVVPHGEDFSFGGRVEFRSFWKPSTVQGRFQDGATVAATVANGAFTLHVPGRVEPGPLELVFGDSTHSIQIEPLHRPSLSSIEARVRLPEYVGREPGSEKVASGLLKVLRGSQVGLVAALTRPAVEVIANLGEEGSQGVTLNGVGFESTLGRIEENAHWTFRWRDEFGLTNVQRWKFAVLVEEDQSPIPELRDLFRELAILESEVLPLKIRASDDYGLSRFGYSWRVASDSETNAPSSDVFLDVPGRTNQVAEHSFNFSAGVMGVAEDAVVELRAFAADHMPGRGRAESPAYRVTIVGNARHAELIRQNLESLMVQLEEVAREQERLLGDTKELQSGKALDSKEAAAEMDELRDAQAKNAEALKELAREGMNSLREALRNPAFSEEMLADWAKTLQQMQKTSQEEMKAAAEALQAAAKSGESGDPAKAGEQMAEAAKREEEAAKALQAMQSKVNQGLDDLQAMTLAQRLRKAGSEEKRLEAMLQKNIPETIGLTADELPDTFKKSNAFIASQQEAAAAKAAKLNEEISRFFERTRRESYGKVAAEMKEANMGQDLERISKLIQENVGMEAMETLALWNDRMNAWAALLDPPSDPDKSESGGGSGGGGGAGEGEDETLKTLMALFRMRERQVNVQERTRLLEQRRSDRENYENGALMLAVSQSKLTSDLRQRALENKFATLASTYDDTRDAMLEVQKLLDQPRTDQPTQKAEDESVALLTDLVNLVNEEAKKQSSSSSAQGASAQQMAFLMQMMSPQMGQSMQMGQSPGGNPTGGGTGAGGESAKGGDVSGRQGERRDVESSSGSAAAVPSEFRQALENYFKAVESQP